MASNDFNDKRVNQVLPGSINQFGDLVSNFGLNNFAIKSLISNLGSIDRSLANVVQAGLTPTSTPQEVKAILSKLGLYSEGVTNSLYTQPFVFSFQNLNSEFSGPAKFYKSPTELGSNRWILPVPPADFEVSVPNDQVEISTVHGFNYTHSGNIGLEEISFESFFPHVTLETVTQNGNKVQRAANASNVASYIPEYLSFDGTDYSYQYRTPRAWVENLVTAMRANQPLLFSIYPTDGSGSIIVTGGKEIIAPTPMSVAAFDWNMGVSVGGSRKDINYSITLKRWKRQSIQISNYVSQPLIYAQYRLSTARRDYNTIVVPKSVAGRPSPTLVKIAIDILHDGRRWREIRKLNEFYDSEPGAKNGKKLATNKVPANHRPMPGRLLLMPK